jgi:hypothetical protein
MRVGVNLNQTTYGSSISGYSAQSEPIPNTKNLVASPLSAYLSVRHPGSARSGLPELWAVVCNRRPSRKRGTIGVAGVLGQAHFECGDPPFLLLGNGEQLQDQLARDERGLFPIGGNQRNPG